MPLDWSKRERGTAISESNFWETRDPPRQVRIRAGARWFFVPGLFAAALIVAGVAAVLLSFTSSTLNTLRRLEVNGKFATAWLEKLKFVDDQRPRISGSPDVDARYVFTVAGNTYAVKKDCGHDQFPSWAVQVLYWPDDPSVNLIRDTPVTHDEVQHAEQSFWGGLKAAIGLYVGVVLLIALPFAIIPGEVNINRQLELARRGAAAEAVITRLVRDSLGRRRLHYEFPTDVGTCRGNSLVVHRTLKRMNPQVGQRLTALFDPFEPRRNILVLALDAVEAVGMWREPAVSAI